MHNSDDILGVINIDNHEGLGMVIKLLSKHWKFVTVIAAINEQRQ